MLWFIWKVSSGECSWFLCGIIMQCCAHLKLNSLLCQSNEVEEHVLHISTYTRTISLTLTSFVIQVFTPTHNTEWPTYITDSGERVTDVPHWVGGEGDVGEVSGEGVPPGGKGWFSQAVPIDSYPVPLSPKYTQTGITHKTLNIRCIFCLWPHTININP